MISCLKELYCVYMFVLCVVIICFLAKIWVQNYYFSFIYKSKRKEKFGSFGEI